MCFQVSAIDSAGEGAALEANVTCGLEKITSYVQNLKVEAQGEDALKVSA